ncbi:MAG: hypothetical protein ACRYG8_49660 [Janthinobacterium lividum]
MMEKMDLYELPVRRALAEMSATARDTWRTNYLTQEGAEHRVQALVERTEASMRGQGDPTTIRTVWMLLADRAGQEDNADLRAAAALAGIAMGLKRS